MLELLVVMAIMAGLVAIALPSFVQLFARVRYSYERSDVERQLYDMPQLVRQRGRGGVLVDSSLSVRDAAAADVEGREAVLQRWDFLRIDLPQGWSMRVPRPLFYRFTGACSGGEVDLSTPSAVFRYRLAPPLCRPQAIPDDAR